MQNWFDFLKAGLSRGLPEDQISGKGGFAKPGELLRYLRPFLLIHWKQGILGAVFIIFSTLITFPQPLVSRYLVDDVILMRRIDLLSVAVLLLAGLYLFNQGSDMLQQYYFMLFEQGVMLDVQKSLMEHILRLPKSFFDEKETGYLISRISSDIEGLRWFFSGIVVYIFTNLIRFVGGIAFLFYLEWRLALVTLVALPALIISVRYFSSRMHTLSLQGMEQRANILKNLEETLSSIPLIKAFTSENLASKRVVDEITASRQISMEQSVVNSYANMMIQSVPTIAKAVVYFVGAFLAIRGEWTLGSLLAFQAYLGYVYGPAMFFASTNLELQNSLAALERVTALFKIIPEENLDTGYRVSNLKGDVEFNNVHFSYNSNDGVLADISFHIRPGEHIAIVGPSGVGKTTLISLILYFYKPTGGDILFDGKSASLFELSSLRKRISFVAQSTLLLAGTIRENLIYGNPEATQAEIEKAAMVAGIHDFIISLKDGYESVIGEHGTNFSEGQKQRFSIARALIKSPDILILDEPTSALDSVIEKSIFDVLPEQMCGKTLFIVSHRMSTVRKADRIIVLNEKESVQIGTHDELMANNNYYRSIYMNSNSQNQNLL